ncbi:MAG: sensor histidine kinase [Terriglobales bacterium]
MGCDLNVVYAAALADYLAQGGESHLQRAYELGRQALGAGHGILDLVGLHQETLQAAFSAGLVLENLQRAGEFLAEAVSPFEMTHRAYGEANETLRRLNGALEAETQRIARALHDESGQLLAAVHIQLHELARGLPGKARARLSETDALLTQIEEQLRSFARELRPAVLDDYGLAPALQVLADNFSKRTGIPVQLESQITPRAPQAIEAAMYRIAQEALNNVARHAAASQVRIRSWRTPGSFHCQIRDNGVGFQPKSDGSHRGGLGLLGMKERLTSLGGTLQFLAADPKGTELRISIPLGE